MPDLTKPGGCLKVVLVQMRKHRKNMIKEQGEDYYFSTDPYDEMILIVEKIQRQLRNSNGYP